MATRKKQPDVPARPPIELSDPQAIRALAHPARLAVIEQLFSGGTELTATECAELAGLSPSAMSYHLRSLEKAGIVERAESTGDGRERPWRAAGGYIHIKPDAVRAGFAASAAFTHTVLGRTLNALDDWMGRRADEEPPWQDTGGASYGQAWMTAAESEALQQRFLDELRRLRDRTADERPADARQVRVAVLVIPMSGPQ